MPELVARLRQDLAAARKSQDKALTLLLGTILADVQNRALELRTELTDADAVDVFRKGIKKRREALDIYMKAGRNELADKERFDISALERYLPAEASDEDIRAAVREAIAGGATAIGAIMGRVMPRFKGLAEGSRINAIAREELAARG